MSDYTPIFSGGVTPWTATTSAAVTGGRVVAMSATGTVAHAGADSAVALGVAAHDAASGAKVAVWPLGGCVHELLSTGAITVGVTVGVVTDTAGQVKTATIATAAAAGTLIGIPTTTVAGAALIRVVGR